MKYILKKAYKFGWEGLDGWAYNSKDDFPIVNKFIIIAILCLIISTVIILSDSEIYSTSNRTTSDNLGDHINM